MAIAVGRAQDAGGVGLPELDQRIVDRLAVTVEQVPAQDDLLPLGADAQPVMQPPQVAAIAVEEGIGVIGTDRVLGERRQPVAGAGRIAHRAASPNHLRIASPLF